MDLNSLSHRHSVSIFMSRYAARIAEEKRERPYLELVA